MISAVATIFSSLDFLSSSVSMAKLSRLVAATLSSHAFLSSSVSTANLSCSLSTIFSSLRFLSNSLSSPRLNLLRVAWHCFLYFFPLFLCLILSLSFLYSSVSEALFALSFSFLSERFFSSMLKLLQRTVEMNNTGVTSRFKPTKTDFEHART